MENERAPGSIFIKRRLFTICCFFLLSTLFLSIDLKPKALKTNIYVIGNSKGSLMEMLSRQEYYSYKSFNEYFLNRYKGIPYGAMPLENAKEFKEGMTLINFETMDCVTFLENFIAAALTYRQINYDYRPYTDASKLQLFIKNLDGLRYYEGANCTWNDKIYYFTHALDILRQKKLLHNVANTAGIPFNKRINYVSTHRDKFKGITDWKRIQLMEKRLSESHVYYFPMDQLDNYQKLARSGDLIALATDVKGLDVSHCGFIDVIEDELYFSHASSVQKKIVFREDFRNYLSKRNSITGIFAFRPLF